MKNENELISIDEFRLQLNELQILEKQYRREEKVEEEPFIYKFEELPMSISSVESWIYFSLHLLWLVHLVFCYICCYHNIHGITNIFTSLKELFITFGQVGNIVNYIMVALIYLAILFPKTRKDAGIVFILDYIGSQTYPYLRYLLELCFYSSAFFAVTTTITSFVVFGLASLASLVQTILLQNFTLRKGQFCCKSIEYAIMWRICLILSLLLGIFGVSLVDSEGKLIGWASGQAILGITLMLCYYSFGIYIYRNRVPRFFFFFLISSFLALSIAILFDSIQSQSKKSMSLALEGPIFLIVIGFFNWSTLQRRRRISICPENTNIKEKVYFFFNKFEHVDIDEEDDCEVRGVLSYHFVSPCPNPKCVANLKEVYDSKKKLNCSTSKIGQSRVSLIKFYVKCLYERALEEEPENIQLRLDYVEFYYLKLKNIFDVLQQIAILQTKLLSPFQRLRLFRLKKFMKKQCNSFSQELYLHNLSMEKTLESEKIFENIQKNMDLVITRYQLFWKYIERNEVFLGDILDTIRPNFALVNQLNQDWTQLADYFSINRRWKFYFLCFSIFIKNQKLKPAAIQDFGNSVEYDAIFKTDNHFIDKTSEKEALYNSIVLFEQNTSYVSVTCDEEKMIIRKVSNYFQRNFDHEPQYLINTSLDVLLPPSIRSFHHSMFLSWVKDGKTNNDECYPIREVLPITSRGYLAPCFKFYKYYLRNEGQVEYIAMLKRNRNDQMLILANEHFQVEAITYSLAQKLKISQEDYKFFRGMSLLSLMPVLPKYTRFAKYISEKDEDFMENDDNQIYYRKQSTFAKAHGDGDADIIGLKKELNLTNLKMLMPTDLEETHSRYLNLKKQEKKNEFEVVRECYQTTLRSKQYLKFRGEMYIRQKSFPAYTSKNYYEFEINELQENNRLEMLKMEEAAEQNNDQVKSQQQIENNSIASFNEVDLQLFLQLNKKKNKVLLFPSKNIFLKDENNQLLAEIRHITSISLSVRVMVAIFMVILIAILAVQISLGNSMSNINEEYYLIVNNQKAVFLLNTQYNLQQVQPGNPQEEAFFILYYTKIFLNSMTNSEFQEMIFDPSLNPQTLLSPYYSDPYPYYSNITCPQLDQVGIFRKMREEVITLSRYTELDITNNLESSAFHIFNNYLFSYYDQTQSIKNRISITYQNLESFLYQTIFIFGLTEVILIIGCFLFILSRLLKVTNGFSELLSIFIQMDNLDIKKILKYMEYVQNLFNHLQHKYQKMSQNCYDGKSGTTSQQQFDKLSTEPGKTEEQTINNTNANLNKKLKKIDLGSQIKSIQIKAIVLIIAFLLLVGLALLIPIIYSVTAHNHLSTLETIGFNIMMNTSLPNQVVTGVVAKYSSSNIYNYSKYSSFVTDLSIFTKSSLPLQLASYGNQLSNLLYSVLFQNFVPKNPTIINNTLTTEIESICSKGQLNSTVCAYLKANITEAYYSSRVQFIQNQQLIKGALVFSNYLINKYSLFFRDAIAVTANDALELTQGFNIVGIYEIHLMNIWLRMTSDFISSLIVQMVLFTCLTLCLVLVFHLIFVEFLITTTLTSNYEMFRRMYENLIPEFVINKEKIIKAKLIKEGFMIE